MEDAACAVISLPEGRRETIEETAAVVSARGGKGVAVRCDHTKESEME
jgi:hypothetical protein